MDDESTILATSSSAINNGEQAVKLKGFSNVASKVLVSKGMLLQVYTIGSEKRFSTPFL